MDENDELDYLKYRLRQKCKHEAVPMIQIEFSINNYKQLFPNNRVKTPIGDYKVGENQYNKLDAESRQDYIGGMYQTLTEPIFIIEKKDRLISVIANIVGEKIVISTHPKKLKRVIEEIKNAADLVYEKPINGRTAGAENQRLAINDDTQLSKNIPH